MKKINSFDTHTKINFSKLPLMRPTGDQTPEGGNIWEFRESMTIWWYDSTRKKYTLRIPSGFLTDFASTPRWIWWWLPPFNPKYTPACLPHDLGYERNGHLTLWVDDERSGLRTPMVTKWSRKAIDQLMLAGMYSNDVSEFRCQAIYRSVRVGGGSAWTKSRDEFITQTWMRRRIKLGYANGVRD